jgi:hypothetical protein
MKRLILVSTASAVILLTAAPAAAYDDAWAQQVKNYMDKAAKPFFDRGYHYGSFFHLGSLKNGASERLSVHLGPGLTTQLMGGCDTDCSDLDLILYDSAGTRVDQDVQADDYPIVSTKPPADAAYTIEVRMVHCRAEPCRYAVQQYVK